MVTRVRKFLPIAVFAILACLANPSDEAPAALAAQSVKTKPDTAQIPTESAVQTVQSLVSPPPGYARITVGHGSFGAWLRELPIRAGRPPVLLYDGRRKANQTAHYAVLDVDDGYSNFREYLEIVFMYAGSASLEQELGSVADATNLRVGDVFIEGGFPGHAVLVIDVAENEAGDRVFLLAQSYMPAQDIHILRSFEDINPWYRAQSKGVLRTPEWDFDYEDLKRFSYTSCEVNGSQAPN